MLLDVHESHACASISQHNKEAKSCVRLLFSSSWQKCTPGGEFCVFRNSSSPSFQIIVVLSEGKVNKSGVELEMRRS